MEDIQTRNFRAVYLGKEGSGEFVEYLNEMRVSLNHKGEARFTFLEWLDLFPPDIYPGEKIIIVEQMKNSIKRKQY